MTKGTGMTILDALNAQGIQYRKSSKPNEIFLCCPFCVENAESQDTRFRLGVNVNDGRASCFNCHWKTRSKEFLVQELNRALRTGMFELGGGVKPIPVKVRLPEDFEVLQRPDKNTEYWNNKAYRYVHSRGVTDWQIERHKIGYSTVGPLAYRIVIPVYYQGKLKALVGRDFTGKQEPKYKNSIGEKVLFNVPKEKAKTAVLVEGVFDALAVERGLNPVWVAGYDSLAVLGHSLTDLQLKQLKGYERIGLWPDPDEAGVYGFLKMVPDLLSVTKSLYLVVPKDGGHDPSDCSVPEVGYKLRGMKEYTPELEQRLRAWVAFRRDLD